MAEKCDRGQGGGPLAFHEIVARRLVAVDPGKVVARFVGHGDLSLGELRAQGDLAAARLVALGVAPGDRVVLMVDNRPGYLAWWYACSKVGAVRVPLNTQARGHFVDHVLEVAVPKVVVAIPEAVDALSGSLEAGGPPVVVLGEPTPMPEGFTSDAEVPVSEEVAAYSPDPWDLAVIQFTSGTTGPSKGAMMTHSYELLMASLIRDHLRLGGDDVYLMYNPLFHIHAQTTFFATLLGEGRMVFPERFSASSWSADLREHGATVTTLLGVMLPFVMAIERDPADQPNPLVCVWAVPAPTEAIREFRQRFGVARVFTSYGTTEVGMISAGEFDPSKPGGCGEPFVDHYEVAVLDPVTDHRLESGEVGECVVRPLHPWTVTQGYFGDPEATVRSFRNQWFHTGDAVRVDEDGTLHYIDRLDDRIRRRAINVSSADVEAALARHPDVAETAAVPVASEHVGGEDEILACVVLGDPRVASDPAAWASRFRDWVDRELPPYARPRYVDLYTALPRTPTEKVAKHLLRSRHSCDLSFDLNDTDG